VDAIGSLRGIHHVRLPVSDVIKSRDWYVEAFGFDCILDFEEEDRLVGVVLELPDGHSVGLHLAPERAASLNGFNILALGVGDRTDLEHWGRRLDGMGIDHSKVLKGHTGWLMDVVDPDGMLVQLHTMEHPTADEA
jgi:catechol 2,3-dioxygenase-like lactoylglutathione lyase family enzyme